MKKFKNFVFGGIQHKIFNLVLITMLLIIAAYTVVILYQASSLSNVVKEEHAAQNQSIEQISTQTMDAVLQSSMTKSTQMEAQIADSLFSSLGGEVQMLGDYAQKLFSDPSVYPRINIQNPKKKNAGKTTVQLMTAGDVDTDDAFIRDEIGLVGNMSDMMCSLFNSAEINSCFLATPNGITVIADDRSEAKFDENGKLLNFDSRTRPWYQGAVERGGLYFTDIEKDAFTDQIGIVCALPIYQNKKLVAVVGADLFLDSMQKAVAQSEENGSFTYIVNQNGHIIFSPKESGLFQVSLSDQAEDLRRSDNQQLADFISKALNGNTEITAITADQTAYYMCGSPMKTVGWSVITVVEKEELQQLSRSLGSSYQEISSSTIETINKSLAQARTTIVVLLIIVLILGILSSLFVSKRIVRPLNRMAERVASLGGDDLQFMMADEYRTGDEIELLAEAFAKLSARTLHYIREITHVTAEKERISTELGMATQIQASQLPHLFPAFPDRTEFDIYASMTPAKEVGGDFYDFFLVDEDHLALVMADVSGKGVPAALFMMISKILIRNCIQNGESPGDALEHVNTQLLDGNETEMFVTVWLAVLELSTGKGIAVNAGHEHPALKRTEGAFELIKYRHSPAVATLDGMIFREHTFCMNPGDVLFVCTDGVLEATDSSDQLFGEERLLTALNREPEGSPQKLLSNVMDGINDFVKEREQFDDITMLCIRYFGPEKASDTQMQPNENMLPDDEKGENR